MEAPSVTPEFASEDKDLKSLLDAFGSKFSLQDIASAFCKAGRDPDLAGQILSETQQSPSTHEMHVSNVPLTSRTHSRASKVNGFCETQHANGNGLKATISKRNPASMGTVSGVLGNYYVWRATNSNGNPNGTKPLKVDASESSMPVSFTDHSLESKDANSRTFEDSSLKKDANMNDDVEEFLFEMLGRGFQLERSAIHEVLGQCGYDMRKSMETLLDLAAANLDKRYDVHKSNNLHSDPETFPSRNQARQQKVAERQPSGIYEQQQEVLTSLFHAPERPGSILSASIKKSARRSRAPEGMVAELPEDISYEHTVIPTMPRVPRVIVEADDDPYQILRKAVKEHRDTMKEYYRAATEAFASGDRARATLLLEKGQYFYNMAREADEESASKIFETSGNAEVQDDMSLDLQDHEVREAIQLVKYHLRTLSGISSIKNLKVMIGSDGRDAERRKRLVIKLLERETVKWTEDDTGGTILIRMDEIKPESLSFVRK
ncbi:putative nuclear RNA export factor SDE5 [Silene latifolia]|uniref:putative nuclear RNA export factor SDE5 n=1 Tax=Silene latifolia TaxID=37657 RepID=UPI003D786C7C